MSRIRLRNTISGQELRIAVINAKAALRGGAACVRAHGPALLIRGPLARCYNQFSRVTSGSAPSLRGLRHGMGATVKREFVAFLPVGALLSNSL